MNYVIPVCYHPVATTLDALPTDIRKGLFAFADTVAETCTHGCFLMQQVQLPSFKIILHKALIHRGLEVPVFFQGGKLMLSYIMAGNIDWRNRENEWTKVWEGDCHLYYENNIYELLSLSPGLYESMHISFERDYLADLESDCQDIKRILFSSRFQLPEPISAPITRISMHIRNILDEIKQERGKNLQFFYTNKVNELLLLYLDAVIPTRSWSSYEQKLKDIRIFIDQHLDLDLSAKYFAKRYGLTERQLRYEFKAKFNISLCNYVFTQRMNRALELLLRGELLVSQLCLEVGYKDAANFTHAFRRFHKQTPSEFRNGPGFT